MTSYKICLIMNSKIKAIEIYKCKYICSALYEWLLCSWCILRAPTGCVLIIMRLWSTKETSNMSSFHDLLLSYRALINCSMIHGISSGGKVWCCWFKPWFLLRTISWITVFNCPFYLCALDDSGVDVYLWQTVSDIVPPVKTSSRGYISQWL